MDYSQFQEKPIQLIYVTEDGKYLMHPDAEQFLSKIPKPLSIISVAGLYRTGKSYLLNRILLNRNNGFGVGPTINPCTKGLWCWGVPLKGILQNGQKTNIIIVDSQGIGALDQDQNHDVKIFTLSVLTSSTFIYNSVGSIDQNALQNLSLVVNLTKNIQLNSQFQDQDPEDLAKYFPTFYWVVRDFALQLINSEGQNISPKQYLERALAPQKGFSDDVQEKNRIRRMLTSFFKERQCATLVRPLVNEQKLQHLYQCSFQELRPEFVQQALTLRKKIFSNAKPKIFKGEVLDGSMYVSMIKSYAKAINEGGVPNIENAWTYMCIQKCLRLQQQCYKFFATQVQSSLQSNFPCPQEAFQEEIQRIQRQALEMFQKQEIGEQSKTYFLQLQKRFKDKVVLLKMQNQKQSINFLKNFIMKNFTTIQKKMRMNEFQNFQDFLKTINNFYFGLIQNGPDLPKKQIVYLDFLKKVVSQGAQIFLKQANQNFQSLKNLTAQKERILSSQNRDLKQKIKVELEKYKQREEKGMVEKNQLSLTCKLLQSQLNDLKKNHRKEVNRLQESTDKKIKMLQVKYQQAIILCDELKEKNHSLQSSLMIERKEREKEKALLQLKANQFKEEIRVLIAKDKQQQAQINELSFSYSTKLREQAFQTEKKMNQLNSRLKTQINKNVQLTESVAFMTAKIQKMEQTFSQSTKKYQQQLKMKIEKYQNQRLEFQTQKGLKIQFLEQENNKFKTELQQMKSKYNSVEKISKESNDKIKILVSDYETKLAIESQKSEFLKIEVNELKQKHMKDKNHYEAVIKNMRIAQEEQIQKMMSNQRQKLEESYKDIIRNLQNQITNKTKQLEEQSNNTTKLQEKVKFQYQIQLKKVKTELKSKLEIIQHLEDNNQNTLKEYQSVIRSMQEQTRNKEQVMQLKIQQLQQQIENLIQKSTYEQEQNNNRSEETLKQIKNYYQLEKEKLEHKIALEKDKYQKRLLKFKQEYEGQIQEERKVYEEQIDNLRDEFHNQTTLLKELVESLTHQNDSKNRSIEIYQKRIVEQKQKLQRKQIEYSTRLQNIIKNNSTQKQAIQTKISEISEHKNKLQKQIIVLQHQKDQLAKQIKEKTAKQQSKNEEVVNLNKNIQKIQHQNRQKLSEINNANMNEKLNYEKKIALLQQEKQFYTRKITDSQKESTKSNQVWEEKLQKIKNENQEQLRQLETRKAAEYESLEAKYEKIKKINKEFQQQTLSKINQIERELTSEKEKYSGLSLKYKDLQEKKILQVQQLANELTQIKENLSKITKQSSQEIEQLKKTLNQIENEKAQVTLMYEKDKILTENKLNFLEEIKEKNKKEYVEQIRSLEQTLENMQKARVIDKNYYENTANQNLSRTEKKYQAIIQESNQNYFKKEQQYEQTIKKIQMELRSNSERFSNEVQMKQEVVKSLQKKVKDLQQSEKRSQYELERYKNSKQLMNSDNLNMLQREKENLKLKIHEKEEKYKKIEGVKQQLFLDIEREKAKWNLEKDNYAMKVDELKEVISKYERDNQKLQRQNQKLKAERKNNKMSTLNGFSKYSLQRANSKYLLEQSVSSINLSVSKQSCNPLGQISFFNNH